MKRMFAAALAIMILFSFASAKSVTLTKFEKHIMKYNTIASDLGEAELEVESAVDQDGMKWFYLPEMIMIFQLDSDEEIQSVAFRTTSNKYDADKYLRTCVCLISLLSGVTYEGYGMMLYQYIHITSGQDPFYGAAGIDTFYMQALEDGSLMFVYNNNDRQYCF